MNAKMNGRMDGWMNAWIERWIDGRVGVIRIGQSKKTPQ